LKKIQLEIEEIKDFVMAIRTDTQETTARYTSLLHAIDHLERMSRLTIHNLSEVKLTNPLERIYPVVFQMEELILESIEGLQNDSIESVVPKLSTFSQELAEFRKKERAGIFEVTAKGDVQINEAFQYVKLILLVDGITHHLWRIMHHISEGNKE
jgi:Asp-tRNA(Asn)/Glu-tRNA(Gln) amidotransferase C subunit